MVKQVVGFIFLIAFLTFLGYKFTLALDGVPYASLIAYLSVLIIVVIVLAVAKQLRGY